MAASMVSGIEEKPELKIAVPVDNIRPGTNENICFCGEGRRHQICAIQNGTKHVYIYENLTRKGILHLLSSCQCMCVSGDAAGGEYLICGLQDGRIIHQNLQHFRDETRPKKKKKKKDKHRSEQEPKTALKESEEDIFNDLLNTAEAKPSCSYNGLDVLPPDVVKDELMENIITLDDAHLLVNEPNIQDLILANGCMVTCAECTEGWTLSVYCQEVKGHSPCSDKLTVLPAGGKTGFEFQKSSAFRTFLPESGIESSGHYSKKYADQSGVFQHLGDSKDPEVKGSERSGKPQLFCVISRSMLGKGDAAAATPAKTLILEDTLYNQLFGTDLNLLDTPIILICLPDGHIYHSPLRLHGSTSVNKSELDRTGSSRSGLGTSLFYVLDQPVATIHGFNTGVSEPAQATENLHHVCDCVCIVGQYGKIVQISVDNSTNKEEKLMFTESFTKGPVETTCTTRTPQTLLYSTNKEIYSLSFWKAPEKDAVLTAKQSRVSSSLILELGQIRALAEVCRASKDSRRSTPIVALTASGKVLKLHPPTDSSHGNRCPPITAATAGERMQELLQAMSNISSRSSELAKLGEAQDQILQEISQACHVAGSLLSDNNCGRNSSIFGVEIRSLSRNDGSMCNLELLCQLSNHSQWNLSRGWSLMMSMTADSDWTKLDEETRYHVTKSVPLVNFQPLQTTEAVFPLKCGETPLSLPVEVQCFLHFSQEECAQLPLPEKKNVNAKSHFELSRSGISLPLIQPRVIDLVTVLRPSQSDLNAVQGTRLASSQSQTSVNRGRNWFASALQSAAQLRPSANKMARPNSEKTNEGPASIHVNISSDITSLIQRHQKYGTQMPECSLKEQITRWLFEDNKHVTQLPDPFHLLAPDGQLVTLQVKGQGVTSSSNERETENPGGGIFETSEGKTRREGKESLRGEAVEIVFTAPDYLLRCQLQLALDRRLKTILGSEGTTRGITTNRSRLQNELRKVQALQRKVQSLQDTLTQLHSSDNHWRINGIETLEIYQQMRSQLTLL